MARASTAWTRRRVVTVGVVAAVAAAAALSGRIPNPAAAVATFDAPPALLADGAEPYAAPREDRLPERVRGRTIPLGFFGLHLLSLGIHGTWPAVPFGIYRMWDGVYRWHTMRPEPGTWYDWSLDQLYILDDLVAGRAELMFTLAGGGPNGGFPPWLDPWSDDRQPIHAEWRYFVRTLGERYQGRIRYWEIWNEIDCTCFFHAPVDLLVELTDIAVAELKAIDPDNVLISAINSIPGSQLFDDYLRLGGAANVDIVAWHIDTPHVPERDTAKIRGMRAHMERHGLGDRPLWTTEGHTRSVAGASAEQDAAILARHFLVLWSHGSEHFSWYAWDVWDYGVYQGHRDWVTVSTPGQPWNPTPAGIAYGVLAEWLVGASMTALHIDGTLWQIEIERPGGYRGTIIWHTEGGARTVTVPAHATRMRFLDGSATAARAGAPHTTSTAPVLFDS